MRQLERDLKENRTPAINDGNSLDVQVLCLAEEAGELVGAYRRWAGMARRSGTFEEMASEAADVLIVLALFAEMTNMDLERAVRDKLEEIYSRGWKEESKSA